MLINTTKIKIIMAQESMTLSQLALQSGITRQNISTILSRGSCTPLSVGKIARGLGVPVEEIILEE